MSTATKPAAAAINVEDLTPEQAAFYAKYGRLPPKKKELLGKQLQGKRQYFDSGDYALSKAGKAPMKEVGSQHPSPDGIPHSVPINLKSPNSASTNSPARESSLSQEANVEGTAIAAESAGGAESGV